MKIGMVILNYNDSETTIELLENIKDYSVLDNIVVVDNYSTDNSYETLKRYESEKIKVIRTDKNGGFGYGNNIGANCLLSEGIDYIIFSNPDIIVEENVIVVLKESFAECKNAAVIAPTINEHGNISKGWKLKGPIFDSFTNINYLGRFFKKKLLYSDEYYNEKYSKVDATSGCFFAIRGDVFEKIDGFDENIFLYYEENVLAKKIKSIDMDILVRNDIQIIHNHSVSINKSYNKIKKFKALAKSQRYYHRKYNNAGKIGMLFLYLSYAITMVISYFLAIFNK